jgi:hypothetical protein
MIHPLAPALFCLALGSPALAAPCTGLEDLLQFINDQAGYALPSDCPSITPSALLAAAPALRSQAGAYVPATGEILLAPDLDSGTVLGRSYLLHELAHAAQFRAGVQTRVTCEGALEAEAYQIQTLWLRRHGEAREALLIDWVAAALGHCGDTHAAPDY